MLCISGSHGTCDPRTGFVEICEKARKNLVQIPAMCQVWSLTSTRPVKLAARQGGRRLDARVRSRKMMTPPMMMMTMTTTTMMRMMRMMRMRMMMMMR